MVHPVRTHLGAPVLPSVNRSEHREVQGVSYDGAPTPTMPRHDCRLPWSPACEFDLEPRQRGQHGRTTGIDGTLTGREIGAAHA